MTIDTTISVTDIVTFAAVLLSPLIAVQVTEWIRRTQESRARKLHLFRTLMSTRAATLAPVHVEALNLIDIEFSSQSPKERVIVDAWKLYHAHLTDHNYPQESWNNRRAELLVDLLHEMALFLGYQFDKAHIKNSSYYPKGYGETEEDNHRMRKAILAAFENGALKIDVPNKNS